MIVTGEDIGQKSLQKEISICGKGLFTGEETKIVLTPAAEGFGIVFQRMDLSSAPLIRAHLSEVAETHLCTFAGKGNVRVQMVEHLLSALSAYGVDNLLVKVYGSEIPACDGSAKVFVEAIEKAGVRILDKSKSYITLDEPIFLSEGKISLVALPSTEFRISYTMDYPQSTLIGTQFHSIGIASKNYRDEIASCRTFSIYEEIGPLLEKGLIKGGDLSNAVIVQNDKVVNPEGLRFKDEMVRHKILDMIGDLSLLGPMKAHIIAIRSGHFTNIRFAKLILNKCLENKSCQKI